MSKMVIGQVGKVYGLQRPKAAATPSIFGPDDDDDNSVDPSKAVLSKKHRDKMDKRAQKEMAKALAQDASVFDYDGVLDNIHQEREKAEEIVKGARKQREVRYVHSLLKVTEQRKKEDEILFEKRLLKELEEEQQETATTEKFVTSAYKRQLQANQKWTEEKAREDARIAASDVRNKEDISDFYTNMLKGKNKATGATVRGASPPKDHLAAPVKPPPRSPSPAAGRRSHPSESSPTPPPGAAAARSPSPPAARGSLMPSAAEAAAAATARGSLMPSAAEAAAGRRGGDGEGGDAPQRSVSPAAAAADRGARGGSAGMGGSPAAEGEKGSKRRYDGWVPTAYGYVREKAADGPTAANIAVAATADKKSQDAVLSVRERYLARKAQKLTGGTSAAGGSGS